MQREIATLVDGLEQLAPRLTALKREQPTVLAATEVEARRRRASGPIGPALPRG